MLGALVRLLLYRLLGARIVLGLTILGWLRNAITRWRASRRRLEASGPGASRERGASLEPGVGREPSSGQVSAYQPSQGSSQTVQRDPR